MLLIGQLTKYRPFTTSSLLMFHRDGIPGAQQGPAPPKKHRGIASYVAEVQLLLPGYHLQGRRFGGANATKKTTAGTSTAAPVLGAGFGAMAEWNGKKHYQRCGFHGAGMNLATKLDDFVRANVV